MEHNWGIIGKLNFKALCKSIIGHSKSIIETRDHVSWQLHTYIITTKTSWYTYSAARLLIYVRTYTYSYSVRSYTAGYPCKYRRDCTVTAFDPGRGSTRRWLIGMISTCHVSHDASHATRVNLQVTHNTDIRNYSCIYM